MQCERLLKQIKTWYGHVQNETMAPARMISFIENHVAHCSICQVDPDLPLEISKITEIILPESKIPKAIRMQHDDTEDEEIADETEEGLDLEEDSVDNGTEEEDELDLFDPDDEI